MHLFEQATFDLLYKEVQWLYHRVSYKLDEMMCIHLVTYFPSIKAVILILVFLHPMDAKEGLKIKLKLFVYKESNRVVFAEADKDFVDVLFSFLTLPMGTIVRLLQKQSLLSEFGSMNTLYEGLEKLDVGYFITSKHKDVLLRPSNSAEADCRKLKVNIDDTEPTKYYCCQSFIQGRYHNRCSLSTRLGLCTAKATYKERKIEAYLIEDNSIQDEDEKEGVFVNGSTKFTISDDLKVMPMSASSSFELLFKLGIKDHLNVLEEKIVEVGLEEVLSLLRLSLLSKTPLTDWSKSPSGLMFHCYQKKKKLMFHSKSLFEYRNIISKRDTCNERMMILKVMFRKSNNKILYAESQGDFVNYLLSFLTIPLGSVLNLLENSSSLGCISNMYASVKEYSYLKNEYSKTKLISPKISAQFCYQNHPLGFNESFHPKNPCKFELFDSTGQKHVKTFNLDSSTLIDKPIGKNGFVEVSTMYMVTDDLIVMPSSYTACKSLLNKLKVPLDDLEEQVLSIGGNEAFSVFEASLACKTALTSALNLYLLKKPKIEK